MIAASIGVAPSTVSRELERNGGSAVYRAAAADERAWSAARRPKPCRLATNRMLRALVAARFRADWSPQQIAGWLATEFPENAEVQISHETIYRTLFVQTRGALKNELIAHLRSGRACGAQLLRPTKGNRAAQSSMLFQFENGQRRSKIEPFPGTGRAISWPAHATRTSPRSLSDARVSSCS